MSRAVRARPSADERSRARPTAPGPQAVAEVPRSAKADERRLEARRSPRPNRALAMAPAEDPGRQWFPRNWPYMILCMIGAIVSSAVAAQSIPGIFGGALLGLAVAGACCAQPIFDRVRNARIAVRLLAVLAVVILPMFLFGFGMTIWTIRQGLPWDIAVAALLGVGIIAAVYLRRQPGVTFAGQ